MHRDEKDFHAEEAKLFNLFMQICCVASRFGAFRYLITYETCV